MLAANALTTLESVQDAFGGRLPATPTRVLEVINAASGAVEKECGRCFGYVDFTATPEELAGNDSPILWVSRFPILAVSAITYHGKPVDGWKLRPQTAKWGGIHRFRGWWLECNYWGDLTIDPNPEWVEHSFAVAYTAGFVLPQFAGSPGPNNPSGGPATLPWDVKEATTRACVAWLSRRADPDLRSEKTPGGWARTYDTPIQERGFALPPDSLELLQPHHNPDGAFA